MKHHLLLVKDTFLDLRKLNYINRYETSILRAGHKTNFFIEAVYKKRIVHIYFDTVEDLNTAWLNIQIIIS